MNSEIQDRINRIAVAALVHDLGKLGEAAKVELESSIEVFEQDFCPTNKQKKDETTHKHVLHTARVLDEVDAEWAKNVFRLACSHHKPLSTEVDENLLQKADWLSSGSDRTKAEQSGSRVTGMKPILSELQWPAKGENDLQVPISSSNSAIESLLPCAKRDFAEYQINAQTCENEIVRKLRSLGDVLEKERVSEILGICNEFLKGIPSSRSYDEAAVVSLFDHSRTTAAIAACLALQSHQENHITHSFEGKFKFVDFSLGSIQDFIFRDQPKVDSESGDSGTKGMAKQLRARSFYVSVLSHVCGVKILDSLGLPITNIIFDAGGHCKLLVPGTEKTAEILKKEIAEIRQWFVQEMIGGISLKVGISQVLRDDDLKIVSDPTQQKNSYRKTLSNYAKDVELGTFSLPYDEIITENGWNNDGWVLGEPGSGLPIDSSAFSNNMKEFGDRLVKNKFLTISNDGITKTNTGGKNHVLPVLGYSIELSEEENGKAGSRYRYRLSEDVDSILPLFPAANYVPIASSQDIERLKEVYKGNEDSQDLPDVGKLITFEHIARLSRDDDGDSIKQGMLAILKADVDNLGLIMQYGLGNLASIGRHATMSRELDDFFKGFLRNFLKQNYPYTYTVFAGGDDLFLVGPWFDIVRLARDLRRHFSTLTCGNPGVTFSAGVVFTKPSTPVRHFAEFAEEALEKAKDADEDKDKINIAGQTLTWSDFNEALDLHNQFMSIYKAQNGKSVLPTSLLYRLLVFAKKGMKPVTLQDHKWRSQLNYDLGRNLNISRRFSDELNNAIKELHSMLIKIQTPHRARILFVATTLALYRIR